MNVIYVDDEPIALAKFSALCKQIAGLEEARVFGRADDALAWAKEHPVDLAFLDVEMPGMNGMALAKALHATRRSTRIVFVTAYDHYALEAFETDAVDYLLKPYGKDKLERALEKAKLVRDVPEKKVFIQTFGGFDVFVDGMLLPISSPKPKELLALLVDKRGGMVMPGVAISCLWEDRPSDASTASLYRMTGKRLRELLTAAGIGFLLVDDGYRAVNPDAFTCDRYAMENGDKQAIARFGGDYMPEYAWAEDTNARLTLKYT